MTTELSPKYDPSAVEAQAYKVWLDEKCFHADPAHPGPAYSIVIPPPNVTGALHLGHAINTTLQDILTRMHRMAGFNTLWIPGIDHAGIATQAVVEKQLKEQENKTRHDVGREGLVERIWQWKQQYGDRILSQLQRLGCSCDWDRTRFTLDEMCAKAVRETFFKLFKDGLIYRGKRLVNWDTFLQTSISDDEIYHETVKTNLWHIRYPIEDSGMGGPPMSSTPGQKDHGRAAHATADAAPAPSPSYSGERAGVRGDASSGAVSESASVNGPSPQPSPPSTGERESEHPTYMVVATTRPETMLGDTAVAVHSEDPRWNWAIGKHVRLPLTGRLIPIIADDILVDPKFGTGVVKVTPAHDPNDYAVWSRHKGQPDEIEIINILTQDGKITADRPEWSKYAGMKRNAARTAVVEDLKSAGLLEKEEPYETQVGHSDRSKTPVEPYLSDQWFVKMAPLAEPALQAVREGKIKFYPERHAQQYLAWLGEKRDWPVSRQLWWGHRIPVWTYEFYCAEGETPEENGERYRTLIIKMLNAYGVLDDVSITLRVDTDSPRIECCARNSVAEAALDEILDVVTEQGNWQQHRALEPVASDWKWLEDRTQPSPHSRQDPDVLDTWFSSALWPHSTLGWPEKTPELARYYPTSVLLTGRDIITLWVARMVMMGMYNMGASGTPAPSPLYSGERAGERGDAASGAGSESLSKNGPSPQPSPPSTGEREQDSGTGGPPVCSSSEQENHGRAARATEAAALGLPFLDVAINPTILDGKGERMSKSKGNGVDPVDIIDSYGADALRFTLTKMATETQDARMPVKRDASGKNTSEKFDEGRNFCNKLWNACRFALSNLEAVGSGGTGFQPVSEAHQHGLETRATLSLADRWIIARFHRAVGEANDALKNYRFDVYAKACYDFFWRDFCDWYVEAIKPAMKDPARAPHTASVLAAVLDGSLRLMHPMIPFITETVWWRLNDIRPVRGLGELLQCPPSKRLVLAQWPGIRTASISGTPVLRYSEEPGEGGRDFSSGNPGLRSTSDPVSSLNIAPATGEGGENAESIFTKLQELIIAIRTVRNDYQVNPKQAVKVSIKAPADLVAHIGANRELIELLGTSSIQAVGSTIPAVENAVTASAAGAEIFIEGLIDPNAEKGRLTKEIEAREKSIAALRGRLGNEAYIAKAPPKLVQETKDQLAAAEAEVVKMKEALAKLG